MAATRRFDAGSFVLRWAVALALVFSTFNPTDYSYYNWVRVSDGENLAYIALAGIVLLILYVIFLRATWRSIGLLGITLSAAFFGALIWVGIELGWIDLADGTLVTWIALFVIATVMAIGISWSHIRRQVTGQLDTDDVDED
jgi:hypothetical protein